MAELTTTPETTTTSSCCAPEQQATGCGGAAQAGDVREQVRERYAAAAVQVTTTDPGAGCAPSETFDGGSEVFGAALYALGDREQLPDTAKLASLGCGNPTAVAELHEARRSSTSAPAAELTYYSPPSASARPAKHTVLT